MQNKSILGLCLFALSVTSNANNIDERTQVFNIMKKYVESTACGHTFESSGDLNRTNINNVYLISNDRDTGNTVYFVFWGGDVGCNVGSGTMSYYMSEVSRYSKSRPFLVQNNDAFGKNVNINFRFIQNIRKIKNDEFEIISWNYADDKYGGVDGGNNFPANKFKYIVKNSDGGWHISKQSLIEQNN
ncbi:hypothetical protein A7P53_06410 [Acinetobacter defluvii]|nr:hypothetical protein [Acinetobacter defluvii]